MDRGAVPRGDLHQHARRLGLDLGARAAHQPGDRRRPVGVLDHDHLRVERARLPVERLHLLVLTGTAHGQPAAGDAVEVEGMQRLARQQHRVVGDVDDVVDRTLPGGHQPRLQPGRRRTDLDVLEYARGEARAQLGALDDHLGAVEPPVATLVLEPRLGRERRGGRRVQLARDAVHAETVGAVGRDLELDHVGLDRQDVGERRAGGELRVELQPVEHHDPLPSGADLQLALGQDHPFGDDTAELGLLELRAIGHHRPRPGDGDGLPGGDVGGTAHDCRGRPLAPVIAAVAIQPAGRPEVDLAHAQPVGVGVRLHVEHTPDDEAVGAAHTVVMDRLDLRPGQRQALLDLVYVERRVTVFPEPCERHAHQNCSRKRRSLS